MAYLGGQVLHQFKYGNKTLACFNGEFACHPCAFLSGEIERRMLNLKFVGRPYGILNVSSCLLFAN